MSELVMPACKWKCGPVWSSVVQYAAVMHWAMSLCSVNKLVVIEHWLTHVTQDGPISIEVLSFTDKNDSDLDSVSRDVIYILILCEANIYNRSCQKTASMI